MTGVRSWLYVPGDRPDRFGKAVHSAADAVVIDLEDAVSPDHKAQARHHTVDFLTARAEADVHVRINPPKTGGLADLVALRNVPLAGLRLPKAEHAEQVSWIAEAMPGVPLWPIVESALGVEHAYQLATAHAQVTGLLLGNADLAADLHTSHPDVLDTAALRVLIAAAAAGLPSPPMSVYPALHDVDGLARDCRRGRERGFFGRSVLHPRQIPVVNEVFTIDRHQLAEARAVLSHAADHGSGAGIDPAGRFVDAAVVRQAQAFITRKGDQNADS